VGIHKRPGHSACRLLQLFLALRFSNTKVRRFKGKDKTLPGSFYAYSEVLKKMSTQLCLQIIRLRIVDLLLSRGHVQLCGQVVELSNSFYDRNPMLSGHTIELQCLTANPES